MRKFWPIIIMFMLEACLPASPAPSQNADYTQSILNRPVPITKSDTLKECSQIRSEIARQQGVAGMGSSMATSPFMAAAWQATAQQNIAVLNSRAANIKCIAAFSDAASTPDKKNEKLGFDQCFAKCKKLTNRTSDQCFDACNH